MKYLGLIHNGIFLSHPVHKQHKSRRKIFKINKFMQQICDIHWAQSKQLVLLHHSNAVIIAAVVEEK